MTLRLFFTLLVVGALTGLIGHLILKRRHPGLGLALILGIAGSFLGYFVFLQISQLAIEIVFAIGGGILLLWLASKLKR